MENKKAAVQIGINLSSSIFSASLVILAMLSGFSTFILQEKEINFLFWFSLIILFFSFSAFVISIYWGGKGIDKARKDGVTGNWDIKFTKREFDNQTKWCILGLVLFLILFLLNIGNQKQSIPNRETIIMQKTLEELVEFQKENNNQMKEIESLKQQVKLLSISIDSIKKE